MDSPPNRSKSMEMACLTTDPPTTARLREIHLTTHKLRMGRLKEIQFTMAKLKITLNMTTINMAFPDKTHTAMTCRRRPFRQSTMLGLRGHSLQCLMSVHMFQILTCHLIKGATPPILLTTCPLKGMVLRTAILPPVLPSSFMVLMVTCLTGWHRRETPPIAAPNKGRMAPAKQHKAGLLTERKLTSLTAIIPMVHLK